MSAAETITRVSDGLEQTVASMDLLVQAIPDRIPPGSARDELTHAVREMRANLEEMRRQLDEALSADTSVRTGLAIALSTVRGCYAALPGADPGILAYVDGVLAAGPGDVHHVVEFDGDPGPSTIASGSLEFCRGYVSVEPASGYERRIVRERDGQVIWPESAETLRTQFEAMAKAAGPTPQGPLAVPMAIPPDER